MWPRFRGRSVSCATLSRCIALALATSAGRSRARSTLLDLGLLDCFQQIVTGEDVLLGKPDAAIYRLAYSRMGMSLSTCWRWKMRFQEFGRGGCWLSCVGVASHETPENLIAAGASHVVRNFEAVTTHQLKRILPERDRDLGSRPAAAASAKA